MNICFSVKVEKIVMLNTYWLWIAYNVILNSATESIKWAESKFISGKLETFDCIPAHILSYSVLCELQSQIF